MTTRLLQILRARSSHHQMVMARAPILQKELSCTLGQLQASLTELVEAGAVRILSPLPFLVVALSATPWSSKAPDPAKTPKKSGPVVDRAYSFQSYLSQSKQLNESYSYSTEGTPEQLLAGILQTLGESDPAPFRKAVAHYSPAAIRATLERVRTAKSIRTNRTALFRFLLPKIARESSPNTH